MLPCSTVYLVSQKVYLWLPVGSHWVTKDPGLHSVFQQKSTKAVLCNLTLPFKKAAAVFSLQQNI